MGGGKSRCVAFVLPSLHRTVSGAPLADGSASRPRAPDQVFPRYPGGHRWPEHCAGGFGLAGAREDRHDLAPGVCCYGLQGAPRHKPTGRPPKLTPTQKAPLATWIEEGPVKAGFSGACWRSPMVQQMIFARFGVYYNVFYIAQLLKNLGFSYQKAAFVSDHLNEQKRQEWRTTTWPQILRRAKARKALLLFGDEASFPSGALTYTWARRGQQPQVKTSASAKAIKSSG